MVTATPKPLPQITLDLTKDETWDRLRLRPDKYQYRLNADSNGVTREHAITPERWEEIKHKPLTLFKTTEIGNDGASHDVYEVADGHHRFNYLKQLRAQGRTPSTQVAEVMDAAAGYNVKTAKIEAAFRDHKFAQGQDNVVDESYALKESREADVRQDLLTRPDMTQGNLPLADKLSHLSKESLKMVARGDVPLESAERVVELVQHDEAKQERVMKRISAMIRQEYPNYQPNTQLATSLAAKSNDNNPGFAAKERARRQANTQSAALGA